MDALLAKYGASSAIASRYQHEIGGPLLKLLMNGFKKIGKYQWDINRKHVYCDEDKTLWPCLMLLQPVKFWWHTKKENSAFSRTNIIR